MIGNKILVKVHENADTTESGIYIGQAETTFVAGSDKTVQKTVGTIVAVGTGILTKKGNRRPLHCEIGDVVCFSDTCGKYFDDEHLFIKEGDIAFFMDTPESVEIVYDKPEYYTYGTP